MFARRTLFVLGAGASNEVGLPIGTGLANVIKKKMDIRFQRYNESMGSGDVDLFRQLTKNFTVKANEYQRAAWLMRDGLGLAQSIDDFLDNHRSNALVNQYGKAAIVRSVLDAERASSLYFNENEDQKFDATRVSGTWFAKLMFALSRGLPKEDIYEIFDRVTFIVFNYDRCLEHFLLNALQALYGLPILTAVDALTKLKIIHPYGAVDSKISFGSTRADYVQCATDIKTYTERIEETATQAAIAAEVSQAECIIFLGFGFHTQNLRMLRPKSRVSPRPIFGTALGMSDSDVDVVRGQLGDFFTGSRQQIRLENKLKSADLFDHYAKSLTGGD